MKDNNYKILFVPTKNPGPQNDLLEVSILNGLRNIMGENCVDYPRKKIMYHDFTESPKNNLHGRGFSLLTQPITELTDDERKFDKFDAILYGDGDMYGESTDKELNK